MSESLFFSILLLSRSLQIVVLGSKNEIIGLSTYMEIKKLKYIQHAGDCTDVFTETL